MGKPGKKPGSFSLPASHPRFAELRAALRSSAVHSVTIPPDHPEFDTLKASVVSGGVNGQAPCILSEREKYAHIQAAFAARYAAVEARNEAAEAEEAARKADAVYLGKLASLTFIPEGAPFVYQKRTWVILRGKLTEHCAPLDFDAMSAKAVHRRPKKDEP